MTLYPVILSGGSGTRLWPLSRATFPKQFLALTAGDTNGAVEDLTLLQQTAMRFAVKSRYGAPVTISNDEHRFLVAEQLRAADIDRAEIILEPCARNTAPAAIVAALHIAAKDPEGVMILLPSDHIIRDTEGLHRGLAAAAEAARQGYLVTFGMTATKPETGYGYIKQGAALPAIPGAFTVDRFVEKPQRERAEAMLAEGGFAWNSGMFVLRVDTFLAEAERLVPAMVAACRDALAGARTDLDFLRLSAEAFAACPSESIDVAIMEQTAKAAVVPTEIGWSDVGAWQALWELSPRDDAGNVIAGDVNLRDTKESYLRAEDGKSLAVIGMEGVTVVATGDAVLVAQSDRTAEVKDLVAEMTAAGKKQAREHPLVYRPWGSYQDIDAGPGFRVKRLIVKPGATLSLQRHQYRSEHWVVVTGVAKVTRGDKVIVLRENESTFIPVMEQHRLENPGEEALHLIEVQVGSYVGEDDIERLEDTYGRT
ncbi:mannose-1-phosphate guanylyltransferase/mannose-6-phosphate isomerase [Hwanghaeella grinnelliae]|uniref:mannose-1-phosphate guanylyltransferase n=1 Tax=Hwanghaeella grinnelliae TaxID=2500179 RepID=A0A437QW16_9PROT|nr:mannose-1-phosphate guanylyltransferase/mannose-6-phosphate isomerase [Hwanghaeella grinnelliae]RVU38708.1 mannose-1-phosphate guanylyltransferase/mannose-6-phosphate isomerase [Hwanghaeella grinnelliae]